MDKDGYHGYDMSKLTIPNSQEYSFHKPPNNIIFYNTMGGQQTEVLRITKDGIIGNPDVPVDEAADAVIRALDGHIKNITKRTWAGLTELEMAEFVKTMERGNFLVAIYDIEKKLKEKNA